MKRDTKRDTPSPDRSEKPTASTARPRRLQRVQTSAAQRRASLKAALRLLREERGLSQGRLAEALGVTSAVVSGWETGSRQPSVDRLLQLAELYDLDLGDFGRALALAEGGPVPRRRPDREGPLPSPERLARLLLERTDGELPVHEDERGLAEFLASVYRLAEGMRRSAVEPES